MINDTIFTPQPDGITKVEEHAEVCAAFLKNLEALPPIPPMACEVKFRPEFTDFKVPEWKDLDVWESRDLEMQILNGASAATGQEREKILASIQSLIKAGMLSYQTAQFDIDNDGVSDQVLARVFTKCDPAHKEMSDYTWRHYQVYDPVARSVDVEKSKHFGTYWLGQSLFSYKGVTYYASLLDGPTNEPYFGRHDHANKWFIQLYRPIPMSASVTRPVALACKYVYLPPKNNGGY